ncbi:hypothetical protein F5X99DRAFT_367200 [Biscogniauxia marginata]|nr:hypothetical protein F5X99DRAFT_367200 [Biscogniauxia marginata]
MLVQRAWVCVGMYMECRRSSDRATYEHLYNTPPAEPRALGSVILLSPFLHFFLIPSFIRSSRRASSLRITAWGSCFFCLISLLSSISSVHLFSFRSYT